MPRKKKPTKKDYGTAVAVSRHIETKLRALSVASQAVTGDFLAKRKIVDQAVEEFIARKIKRNSALREHYEEILSQTGDPTL